jgi:DNA-nicking Smr family endonuclease
VPKGKTDGRPLEPEEVSLWHRATRDAKPLKRRRPSPPLTANEAQPPPTSEGSAAMGAGPGGNTPPAEPAVTSLAAAALPELAPGAAPGVDRRTAERLRRGQFAVDARLDLHGHTQEEAHRALAAFIEAAWQRRARCVLVITGKGRGGEGAGVLRAALPRWLNAEGVRARVLAFAPAQAKDGGSGALYVLLRRQR